jgi:CRP/FNR family transcriptional regulator, cyclic AMP receptor protein
MTTLPESTAEAPALADTPVLAARAGELLRANGALFNLTPAEAACIVAQMRLVHFGAGVTLFREGEDTRLDHLLLLLDGEVSVDTGADASRTGVAISILGPGSVIGEMALLDGAPRSASCTTATPVQAAGLARAGLERLIEEEPRAAAKLLVGLGARTAERLRGLVEQLQMYAALAQSQQREIGRLRRGQ